MKTIKFAFLVLFALSVMESVLAQDTRFSQDFAIHQVDAKSGLPTFVKFKSESMPDASDLMPVLSEAYRFDEVDNFHLVKTNTDELGFQHLTLQYFHDGFRVFGSVIKAHVRHGKLESFNGIVSRIVGSHQVALTESAALSSALQTFGASKYKWELPGEDIILKRAKNDPNASFYPKGELQYVQNKGINSKEAYRLAWKFDIYSHEPVAHAEVFVDAQTGETIFRNELMHTTDVQGTATTRYSGVRTIITDSTGPFYRLRETTHGQGVETYNMHNGTNYANATDFTDSNNVWNNFNPPIDNIAADAHWGAETTHEYYLQHHNRNSYDGNGSKLISYVHFDNNLYNANWDGFEMNYGDGNGNNTPFASLDICGHELTHGVTANAAGLIYSYEPGALNESFSDIFGNTIERWARPGQNSWLIGEDFGSFRSMSNPNQFQNPDTYQGTYWATGTFDNGGVHFNSGVQNFWYYLLVDGGSGTNDNGDTYNVSGLGLDTAAMIAYRNLNVYITPSSDHAAARFGAIQSAIDLFGECSDEMIQTWNAWAAVGLGRTFTTNLAAGFATPDTNLCALPFVANFNNMSSGGIHYLWRFGDGTTSTAENPSHQYTFLGNYTITLIAYGCNGATDTIVFPNRIHIDDNQICPINMPSGGTSSSNNCDGFLYDSGGGSNYLDNSISTFSIIPGSGMQVLLTFQSFDYASGDRIVIYDGLNAQSPQIGLYSGTTLPPAATSTNGALTVKESTNGNNNRAGFAATWSCLNALNVDQTQACQVFPNPTNGNLHVDWNLGAAESYSIRIFDGIGKLQVQENDQHQGRISRLLDLSTLADGIYMARLESGLFSVTKKVIVSH